MITSKPAYGALLAGLFIASLALPIVLAKPSSKPAPATSHPVSKAAADSITAASATPAERTLSIPVFRSQTKQVEKVELEDYVAGVVAAEMSPDFELEALKAQAIAARTYIARRLADQDLSDVPNKEAWITDTVQHQAYFSQAELQKQWGDAFEAKMAKVREAVLSTKGKIVTYNGKPIMPAFFSTSNGYTENSEDYWADAIPYLRSVPSPWDRQSPKFTARVTMSVDEFARKLGLSRSDKTAYMKGGAIVVKRTEGRRIASVRIGTKTFTGREVREKLDLASSSFIISRSGNEVRIQTNGYGHGIGMSQWGANGMAKEGKLAEDIVAYYYRNVQIEDGAGLLASFQK